MKERMQVATWLELVNTAVSHKRASSIRTHPVGGNGGDCLALSVNSRLLHDGQGRLTVFRGEDAAARFLSLSGCEKYGAEQTAPADVACGDEVCCLSLRLGHQLQSCPGAERQRSGK